MQNKFKENWLNEIISECSKEVDSWHDWKRSDYVRLEIKKMEENEIKSNK